MLFAVSPLHDVMLMCPILSTPERLKKVVVVFRQINAFSRSSRFTCTTTRHLRKLLLKTITDAQRTNRKTFCSVSSTCVENCRTFVEQSLTAIVERKQTDRLNCRKVQKHFSTRTTFAVYFSKHAVICAYSCSYCAK